MRAMHRGAWALLLLLMACSGPDPNVRSADPYERYLGVRELEETPDAESLREIVARLEDTHFLVVTGALETLANLGDPEFFQHAAPRLQHAHHFVRAQACATLAAIKNPAGIPPLIEVLKDPDHRVRRAAVKALAAFGKRGDVLQALAATVGDGEPSVSLMAHDKLTELTGRADVERSRDAWERVVR